MKEGLVGVGKIFLLIYSGVFLFACGMFFLASLVSFLAGEYSSFGVRLISIFVLAALTYALYRLFRLSLRWVKAEYIKNNKAVSDGKPASEKVVETKPNTEKAVKTESVTDYYSDPDFKDKSFIHSIDHNDKGAWHFYGIRLDVRPYGWETMVDWANYAVTEEFAHVDKVWVNYGVGENETDLSDSYNKNGSISKMPELKKEGSTLSIAGASKTLRTLMKIVWYNQTSLLVLYTMVDDEELINRYVETLVRRTFGTPTSMASYQPIQLENETIGDPVTVTGNEIHLHGDTYYKWYNKNQKEYELCGSIKLTEKTPSILLFEDNQKVHDYVLQTTDSEDYTNQYFMYSVRINMAGQPIAPAVQIDGFIAENDSVDKVESRTGYRFEAYDPLFGNEECKKRREETVGRDLYEKGLRYLGYTTPGNVRLVGICSGCGKSITFKGFNYHLIQTEPLYSDDGLNVEPCNDPQFDTQNGTLEKDGKTYRFYNSFRCMHCGTPYIDYEKYPDMKKFGVLGCSYRLD